MRKAHSISAVTRSREGAHWQHVGGHRRVRARSDRRGGPRPSRVPSFRPPRSSHDSPGSAPPPTIDGIRKKELLPPRVSVIEVTAQGPSRGETLPTVGTTERTFGRSRLSPIAEVRRPRGNRWDLREVLELRSDSLTRAAPTSEVWGLRAVLRAPAEHGLPSTHSPLTVFGRRIYSPSRSRSIARDAAARTCARATEAEPKSERTHSMPAARLTRAIRCAPTLSRRAISPYDAPLRSALSMSRSDAASLRECRAPCFGIPPDLRVGPDGSGPTGTPVDRWDGVGSGALDEPLAVGIRTADAS